MSFNLVPWIVFFPLIGLLLNLVLGKTLPERASGWLASLASGLAFVVAVILAFTLAGNPEGATVPLADWITVGDLNLRWAFRVDTLSVTMMLVVAGVGTLIHIYAIGYMHEDVRLNGDPGRFRRFFVYLNLFIAAMMVLVSADNFLMLFVGWEGVGLCSYLLIGFWFEKGAGGIGNARAAKKAFIVNRVGDFGMLIAIFMIFWWFGSLQFNEVFERVPELAVTAPGAILAITLFMLLGVAGKSAQLPLFVWLPDAMAGPTPVSALIHAATMVTAGVYLVARSNPLYSAAPAAQGVVAWVGGLTALFAATIAVAQFDIKKVLAYSTISQLGFMVAAVGMGAYTAGMFHLVTHAFFKALLFLAAGSVIQGVEHGELSLHKASHAKPGKGKAAEAHPSQNHASEGHAHLDPQDMRNMGGLRSRMKTTYWVYMIGALALAGIFPLAGFFSKDEILVEALALQPAVFGLLLAAAFLTAFYMGRQLLMVFFGEARTESAARAKENPPVMTIPLAVLAVLSVLGGALNLPGVHTFAGWLEHTIENIHPAEFMLGLAGLALVVALAGLGLAWMIYGRAPLARGFTDPLRRRLGGLFTALENKWWVDELYDAAVLRPYKAISRGLSGAVDLGLINPLFDGLAISTGSLSAWLRRAQTGFVRTYALAILFGAVAIMAYLLTR